MTPEQIIAAANAEIGVAKTENTIPKSEPGVTSEAAQEAHEAALASHRTKLESGIRYSLNSAMTPAETEAMLKQLEEKKHEQD